MTTLALQTLLIVTLVLTGGIPSVRTIIGHIERRRTIRRRLRTVGRRTP